MRPKRTRTIHTRTHAHCPFGADSRAAQWRRKRDRRRPKRCAEVRMDLTTDWAGLADRRTRWRDAHAAGGRASTAAAPKASTQAASAAAKADSNKAVQTLCTCARTTADTGTGTHARAHKFAHAHALTHAQAQPQRHARARARTHAYAASTTVSYPPDQRSGLTPRGPQDSPNPSQGTRESASRRGQRSRAEAARARPRDRRRGGPREPAAARTAYPETRSSAAGALKARTAPQQRTQRTRPGLRGECYATS